MKFRLITLVAAAALAACTPEYAFTIHPEGGSGGGNATTILIQPSTPEAGDLVTFDSGLLGAGDRTWQFGDGNVGTGTVVTHSFGLKGTYDVILQVADGGSTQEYTVRLVVGGGEPDAQLRQPR